MMENELITLAKNNDIKSINILFNKYNDYIMYIIKKYNRYNLDNEDLMQEMYFSFKKAIDSYNINSNNFYNYLTMIILKDLYNIIKLYKNSNNIISLEYIKELEDINNISYITIEEDIMFENIFNNIQKDEIRNTIKNSTLADRLKKILILRYGLEDGKERSLSEVGKIMFLTYGEVNSYEKLAFRIIRNNKKLIKKLDYNN